MRSRRSLKIKIIVGMVAVVCVLHYLTPRHESFYHELFRRLYYFPIFLGGFWFGLWGGLRVSLLVTVLYLPHIYLSWDADRSLFYAKLLEPFLFNIAGPIVGALTDRERRQRARNQELQTLAALGEAASSVAHEMKNVVIPIRGFLRRIRENHPLDGTASSYLEIAERESARLEGMTRNMLAFGRRAPLRREDVEIDLLLAEVCRGLQGEFDDHGVRLTCPWGGGGNTASLDRERIRQALVNLLRNALDASEKGQQVTLLAHRDGDTLRLAVEDQGAGIPKEQLDRIFQPFFTTKPKGTGLGLAITHGIVEEHGGEIAVDSMPGRGTRIAISFPLEHGSSSGEVPPVPLKRP